MNNSDNSTEPKKNFNQEFYPKWNTADSYFYHLMKEKRKEMRDEMTNAESVLWEYLKSNKLGVKFRRQHIIGNFIPDFVCLSKQLIIEVDGEIHNFQKQNDKIRTAALNEMGFRIIRFTNDEVLKNIELVIQKIKESLK